METAFLMELPLTVLDTEKNKKNRPLFINDL